VNASNNAMTREAQLPVSRRIAVAEEEAKHHFASDGDRDSKEKDKKPEQKKRRMPIKWILIAVVVLLVAGYFGFRYWQYEAGGRPSRRIETRLQNGAKRGPAIFVCDGFQRVFLSDGICHSFRVSGSLVLP
jgi:hypothetical protein